MRIDVPENLEDFLGWRDFVLREYLSLSRIFTKACRIGVASYLHRAASSKHQNLQLLR